jgi:hypothetical protein
MTAPTRMVLGGYIMLALLSVALTGSSMKGKNLAAQRAGRTVVQLERGGRDAAPFRFWLLRRRAEPIEHLVVRQHLGECKVGVPVVAGIVHVGRGRGLSAQAFRHEAEIAHSSWAFGLSASTDRSASGYQ